MDKLKPILAGIKKYLFWELSLIVVVTILVGWFMSTNKLSASTNTKRGEINAKFSEVNKVSGELPNEEWNKEYGVVVDQARQDVLNTWKKLYAEQKEKVLKWPDNLKKIEDMPPDAPIAELDRYTYLNQFIKDQPEKLRKMVRAGAAIPSFNAQHPGPAGTETEGDGILTWKSENIDQMFSPKETPTSAEVRIAQENLWICQNLLGVIAKVNAKATGRHDAVIKQIAALDMGKDAARKFEEGRRGRPVKPLPSATPPAAAAPAEGRAQPASGAAPSPYQDRYLEADLLTTVPADTDINVDPTAKREFKRVPIYLRVLIDQRNAMELLAECARSPLPVEVRQFRMSPATAVSSGTSGAGVKNADKINLAEGTRMMEKDDPNDVTVEICGVIYMFNPPNEQLLGAAASPPPQ